MATVKRQLKSESPVQSARDAMYRDLIISVGEAQFAEAGFENTHMQDIATTAGISLKTLYNFFPGKQDLYNEVKNVRGRSLLAEVEATVGSLAGQFPSEPLNVILQGMETHLRFFMSHPSYLRINLLEGYAWFDQQARTDPGQEDLWQRGSTVIESLFRFGIQEGMFIERPAHELLAYLISLQQTRLANWVETGMDTPMETIITMAQAEFIRFFCVPQVACQALTPDGLAVRTPLPDWQSLHPYFHQQKGTSS